MGDRDTLTEAVYYHRFKIVISTPLWRLYLRWAYKKCIDDLKKLDFVPDFNKKDFTCLLCGVGNETTADEFIKFVITKNNKAKIIIIDIGNEQIKAIKKLTKDKYKYLNIKIKQINALDLTSFLQNNSVNWIETDGFLEFFDTHNLHKLLNIWSGLLKQKGFITIREPASDNSSLEKIIDRLRIWVAKKWLGVTIYIHTKAELEKLFSEHQFKFISETTFLPTFRRYSLIKNQR